MNYNIIAVPRSDKQDKAGFRPLYIYIYEGAKLVAKKPTGKKVHKDHWDASNRKVKKSDPNATLKNSVINKKISEIEAILLAGEITSGEDERPAEVLKKEKRKEIEFVTLANNIVKSNNYTEKTIENREGCARDFIAYCETINKSKIRMHEINYEVLQGYEIWMRNRGYKPNNIWTNITKFLNSVTNEAVRQNYISKTPFATKFNPNGYRKPGYKKTNPTYLTLNEIELIENYLKDAPDDLRIAAVYFLFMCYTGLSCADAERFRINKHVIDNERIIIVRKKTLNHDDPSTTNILINSQISLLLKFIESNPFKIERSDFERRLKKIAKELKIKKNITPHVGRHSFGASLAKRKIDIYVAKKLLAHKKIETTQIYYHLEQPEADAAMKKLDREV